MRKIFKNLSTLIVVSMLICVTCLPSMAVNYTDGRFIKNSQVLECIKQIVIQYEDYKDLSDKYSICPERVRFSFSVIKKIDKVDGIGIRVPVVYNSSVTSFIIDLTPKHDLSSFDLANLFLNSNEFIKENFHFNDKIYISSETWEPDRENEYDNKYSIITDITENNWREKFSDEDSVIPDLCPSSLMFFELRPGEKFFVEGYEH